MKSSCCIFLLLLMLVSCEQKKQPIETGLEGKELPTFNILLSDSSTQFNTNTIAKGKPTVFYFFNPYCPYCKRQTTDIVEDFDNLKNIQFYLLTTWSFKEMKKFEKDFELNNYSNIVTGIDQKSFFPEHFNIKALPFFAIYDGNRKLKRAFQGKISTRQIKEVAEDL